MKLVIQLFLWVVIIFLGYLVFNAVYGPVKFNNVKDRRYAQVIEHLQDIRVAQLAHNDVTGRFAANFDDLVRFIDTAEFVIVQRRDSTVLDVAYQKTYGIDKYMDIVLIDTLGYASVKDSLFRDDRHKEMMNVPVRGVDAKFEMKAGTLVKNNITLPVFEAKIDKAVVLHDQEKDLILQEKQILGVDEVSGPFLSVGSMDEVNTTGNWPLRYGKQN